MYSNLINDINKEVEKINDRKHTNGIRIAPWDSVTQVYNYNEPEVFGIFRSDKLEKVLIKFEDIDGTKWSTEYYFVNDKLVHIDIDCFRIAGLSGPTWYERAGRYRYWLHENVLIASEVTLIPPNSSYKVSFTADELLDQAFCYADLLYQQRNK